MLAKIYVNSNKFPVRNLALSQFCETAYTRRLPTTLLFVPMLCRNFAKMPIHADCLQPYGSYQCSFVVLRNCLQYTRRLPTTLWFVPMLCRSFAKLPTIYTQTAYNPMVRTNALSQFCETAYTRRLPTTLLFVPMLCRNFAKMPIHADCLQPYGSYQCSFVVLRNCLHTQTAYNPIMVRTNAERGDASEVASAEQSHREGCIIMHH